MIEEQFIIRAMNRAELDLALDWAAAEGWNPGLHDAECFYHTDPQGFFMGFLNGEPIGSISAVAYNSSFGFLGLYLVIPKKRGQGWGWKLWQTAMQYLGERNIGLDGVLAQQDNYKKSGFHLAYRHIRYQGIGGGVTPDAVVALSRIPWEELFAYDSQHFPAPRPVFLKHWISMPSSVALGVQQGDKLKGYGVIRMCREGYKIGPLFADDPSYAELLFEGLIAQIPEMPVFLDVPDGNLEAIALAQNYQMQPVFETARMYTGQPPQLLLNQVFGVTTLELG